MSAVPTFSRATTILFWKKNEGHCVRTTRDRQIMLRLLTVSFVDAVANVTASRED